MGIGFVVWYGVTQSWLLIPVFGIGVVVLGGLTGLLSQKIKTVQRSIVREVSHSRQHMVILIAHRLSTIAHADVIHVLERGRVVETGTHDALVSARGLYHAMWRQQVGEREPRVVSPVPVSDTR